MVKTGAPSSVTWSGLNGEGWGTFICDVEWAEWGRLCGSIRNVAGKTLERLEMGSQINQNKNQVAFLKFISFCAV